MPKHVGPTRHRSPAQTQLRSDCRAPHPVELGFDVSTGKLGAGTNPFGSICAIPTGSPRPYLWFLFPVSLHSGLALLMFLFFDVGFSDFESLPVSGLDCILVVVYRFFFVL